MGQSHIGKSHILSISRMFEDWTVFPPNKLVLGLFFLSNFALLKCADNLVRHGILLLSLDKITIAFTLSPLCSAITCRC